MGKKRYSHMKICVQGLGVNSKGTSHQVRLRTSPTNYSTEKKEINNKCAILIYYKIINNKYLIIRYSFNHLSTTDGVAHVILDPLGTNQSSGISRLA